MATEKPHSVRLSPDLLKRVDRNIALRRLLGDAVSRSDVIREALEVYLQSMEDELLKLAREQLSEPPP